MPTLFRASEHREGPPVVSQGKVAPGPAPPTSEGHGLSKVLLLSAAVLLGVSAIALGVTGAVFTARNCGHIGEVKCQQVGPAPSGRLRADCNIFMFESQL